MLKTLLTCGLTAGMVLSLSACAVYTPAPRYAYAPPPPPPVYYGPPAVYGPVYPAVGVHVGFYDHPRYWR